MLQMKRMELLYLYALKHDYIYFFMINLRVKFRLCLRIGEACNMSGLECEPVMIN